MTVTVSGSDTAYLNIDTDAQASAGWMASYDGGSSYRESTSEPNQAAVRQSPRTSSTTDANDYTMIMHDRLHAAGSFQCDGVANHSQESARHHVGNPTHEGSSSSGIKQHPLGTTQAYDTGRATFALDNSSLLGPPNMTSPTASTPLLNGSHTHRKKYICPFCNMGDGHTRREYTKRTAGTPKTNFTIGTPTSSSAPPKTYKWEFQMPAAFDKHIIEWHNRLFRRSNSTEFVCGFCQCDTILRKKPTCSAGYPDLPKLLDHLRDCHAQTPENLMHYQHPCAPHFTNSYLSPLREMAERSFNDTSA